MSDETDYWIRVAADRGQANELLMKEVDAAHKELRQIGELVGMKHIDDTKFCNGDVLACVKEEIEKLNKRNETFRTSCIKALNKLNRIGDIVNE